MSKLPGLILVLLISLGALAIAAEKPFAGGYLLLGDAAALSKGDKIVVEEFVSPSCANCYLFWKNRKPLGDDVELKIHYLFDKDHGERPVRLMLVARDLGPETEEKTLTAIFAAQFESKANVEDEDVLDALAGSLGFGDAWQAKKNSPEMNKRIQDLAAFLVARGVDRGPRLIVQGVLSISTGTCQCQGDELPGAVNGLLDKVRQYRKEHPAK
ncbi:MAG: hypothetical protein GX444_13660 [Myxococcales bacterium]|nr:hypothetical protein [Myxococcales bacterium]